MVRSFLLYLLGTTLFADAVSFLDLVFVMPLRDLDLVSSYDWGRYALAYLYRGMDETVRQARCFYGFWHAVLVCFLTFLFAFPSLNFMMISTDRSFLVGLGLRDGADHRDFPSLQRPLSRCD